MQHKADEKKAFEDMMAEIDSDDNDSDLDEGFQYRRVQAASTRSATAGYGNNSQIAEQKSLLHNGVTTSTAKMSKEEEEIENFGLPEFGGVGGSFVPGREAPVGGRSLFLKQGTSQAKAQPPQRSNGAAPVACTVNGAQMVQEQLNITKRWLLRPCSINDRHSMKCYVERERSSFGMSTLYRCYYEHNQGLSSSGEPGSVDTNGQNGNSADSGRFMMSAKKKVVNKTSYYLISLDYNPSDDRGSETVLGKVRTLLIATYNMQHA